MRCCKPLFWMLPLLLAVPLWAGQPQVKSSGKPANANCGTCHGWRKPVEERRKLSQPHNRVALTHGQGVGLWCLDCHQSQNPALLHGREGKGVAFDQVEQSCQTCHNRQAADWQVGVHGKRLSGWREEATVLRCPGCHNPHAPRFASLSPSPPPALPKGMP